MLRQILLLVFSVWLMTISVSGSVIKLEQVDNDEILEEVPLDDDDLSQFGMSNNEPAAPAKKPVLLVRLPFAGSGCRCANQKCSCCASIFAWDFDRQACAVMSFSPSELVNFEVLVNSTNQNQQVSQPAYQINQINPNNNGTLKSSLPTQHTDLKMSCLPFTPSLPVDFCVGVAGKQKTNSASDSTDIECSYYIRMLVRISGKPVLTRRKCLQPSEVNATGELLESVEPKITITINDDNY